MARTVTQPGLILYTLPHSSYGAKIAIVLAAKGVAYTAAPPPGGLRSAAYRRRVPMGTIPALVDGDFVLSESEAIAEYLEETHPTPPLLPAAPRARASARLLARFHDLYLEPPLRTLFCQVAPATRDPAVVEDNLARIDGRLAQLATLTQPGPYLAGDRLTLADCGYPSTLMYLDIILAALGLAATYPPALAPWRRALAADPAVAAVVAWHAEAGRAWLAGKLAGD